MRELNNARVIPGYVDRYFLDPENAVWSYWPNRPQAWLKLKPHSGETYCLITADGPEQKLTKHWYTHAELVAASREGRIPVENPLRLPHPKPVTDMEMTLIRIERKQDQILQQLTEVYTSIYLKNPQSPPTQG